MLNVREDLRYTAPLNGYQDAFWTPGIRPESAFRRNWKRHRP